MLNNHFVISLRGEIRKLPLIKYSFSHTLAQSIYLSRVGVVCSIEFRNSSEFHSERALSFCTQNTEYRGTKTVKPKRAKLIRLALPRPQRMFVGGGDTDDGFYINT